MRQKPWNPVAEHIKTSANACQAIARVMLEDVQIDYAFTSDELLAIADRAATALNDCVSKLKMLASLAQNISDIAYARDVFVDDIASQESK